MFKKEMKIAGSVKVASNDPTAVISVGVGNINFSNPNALAEMEEQLKLLSEGKKSPVTLSAQSARPINVVTSPYTVNNAPGTGVVVYTSEENLSNIDSHVVVEIKEPDPNSINITDKGTFLEAQVPLKDKPPAIIVIEKNDKSNSIKITLGSIMNFYTGITIEYNGKKHYKAIEEKGRNYNLSVTPEFSFKSNKEIEEEKAEASRATKPQPTNNFSFSSSARESLTRGFSNSFFGAPNNPLMDSKQNTKGQIQDKVNALFGLNCTFWDCSLGLSISMPDGTSRKTINDCVFLLKEKGITATIRLESTFLPAELNIQNETAETLNSKLSASPQNTVRLNNGS